VVQIAGYARHRLVSWSCRAAGPGYRLRSSLTVSLADVAKRIVDTDFHCLREKTQGYMTEGIILESNTQISDC